MSLSVAIELFPSFSEAHSWTVDISSARGAVAGKSGGASGSWSLSEPELEAVPAAFLRAGAFADRWDPRFGRDGITVRFAFTTEHGSRTTETWSPTEEIWPEHTALLRWAWAGLYDHSAEIYRARMERLWSYFAWGLPARRTPRGVRLFGVLSSSWGPELRRCFDGLGGMSNPEIDMTNLEGLSQHLHPVLLEAFQRFPGATFRVNRNLHPQLRDAGIPKKSMVQGSPPRTAEEDLAMCRRILEAMPYPIRELRDPLIKELVLSSVTPAPTSGRVLVTFVAPRDDYDIDTALARLVSAKDTMREDLEVELISTSSPELQFRILRHGETP